jgi:WhiB family transcriptional regulator, redox-sensing transcriptional regulator
MRRPAYRDWSSRALCADTDPGIFFPPKDEEAEDAKRVCRACPVQLECLVHALRTDERHGVWGGLDCSQRRALRRKLRRWLAASPEPPSARFQYAGRAPSDV